MNIIQIYKERMFEDPARIYCNREGLKLLKQFIDAAIEDDNYDSRSTIAARNINGNMYYIELCVSDSVNDENLPSNTDDELTAEEIKMLNDFNQQNF